MIADRLSARTVPQHPQWETGLGTIHPHVHAKVMDIDTLMAQSPRVNRDDPEWPKLGRRRRWMRRWPGVMSV